MDFLNDDVENWPGHPSFLSSKGKMNSLNVVNDSTERGVKLSADFLDTAKTEENYQNILQVVEDHRKKALSLRSRKRKRPAPTSTTVEIDNNKLHQTLNL